MFKLPGRSGFTLLELMIVIALIVSLATIWMSNFPGAQKSGRDARRREDFDTYRSALELFANGNNGKYPTVLATQTNGAEIADANADSRQPCYSLKYNLPSGITTPYLNSCPLDPKNVNPYRYRYITNNGGTNYCLWTKLERSLTVNRDECYKACSDGFSGVYENVSPGANCTVPLGAPIP